MYTLVFDLLVRVADVLLELFPLKAEHYDYHNLVFCNDHKPGDYDNLVFYNDRKPGDYHNLVLS